MRLARSGVSCLCHLAPEILHFTFLQAAPERLARLSYDIYLFGFRVPGISSMFGMGITYLSKHHLPCSIQRKNGNKSRNYRNTNGDFTKSLF